MMSHPVHLWLWYVSLCTKRGFRCIYSKRRPNRPNVPAEEDGGGVVLKRKPSLKRCVARPFRIPTCLAIRHDLDLLFSVSSLEEVLPATEPKMQNKKV